MGSVTGIELGPESCVLVRVRAHGSRVRVSAVHGAHAHESLPADVALAAHLRQVRRRGRFPKRARVVAWGLHESASATDAAARAALSPLIEAGFQIDDVMRPAAALAMLAARRPPVPGRDAMAWLSINRHGTAIAIVRGTDLLFSREFNWNYREPRTTREELLQRYSLVAHVAPELQHAMDAVREEHDARVDGIVTCGDLPDLRSLTMPLIEELDTEVETLDSLEGLEIVGAASAEELGERAPAIRLACAAAAGVSQSGEERAAGWRPVRWAAAAAAVVLALLLWAGARSVRDAPAPPASPTPGAPTANAVQTPVERPSSPPAQASPTSPSPTLPSASAEAGPEVPPESAKEAAPAATTGRGAPGPTARGPQNVRQESTGTPVRRAPPPARAPEPLNEPLPVVNSILVSPDRRLAVLDGVIVREGEAIGPRVLVRIEPGAVVLREPSGLERRVTMRRRVGPGGGD